MIGFCTSPDATVRTCLASSDTGRSTERRSPKPAAMRNPATIAMMPAPTQTRLSAAPLSRSRATSRSAFSSLCSAVSGAAHAVEQHLALVDGGSRGRAGQRGLRVGAAPGGDGRVKGLEVGVHRRVCARRDQPAQRHGVGLLGGEALGVRVDQARLAAAQHEPADPGLLVEQVALQVLRREHGRSHLVEQHDAAVGQADQRGRPQRRGAHRDQSGRRRAEGEDPLEGPAPVGIGAHQASPSRRMATSSSSGPPLKASARSTRRAGSSSAGVARSFWSSSRRPSVQRDSPVAGSRASMRPSV